MFTHSSTFTKIILCLVILLAFFLRVYKLDQNPPSLSWDEAAAGYNAYTIANWGQDEYGTKFPLIFTSFMDDKHPVWIYVTAIFTKFLGLSDFSTRLPSAIFGVLNVLMVFFAARVLFKSNLVALLASLFLAISPYNLQFSRGEWEANYALFFFLLGLWSFLTSVNNPKKGWLIILSFLSFGIDLFTYHSAKVVVPPMLILLSILYFKPLIRLKGHLYIGLAIFALLVAVILTNPRLLGIARAEQAGISRDTVKSSQTYKDTKNYYLSYAKMVFDNYLTHFTPKFLFETGDSNPRLSAQVSGEFYKIDALFLLLGILSLLLWYRKKPALILLAWILLAPIPAALTTEVPHAHRALFLMGSMHILAALGLGAYVLRLKSRQIQAGVLTLALLIVGISFKNYLDGYYNIYPKKYAIEWQYGMKQIVQFVGAHHEYNQVYMTDERHQPYIFFLYYLKYPLPDYLQTVDFNKGKSNSYNLVSSFDRFHFGDWDPIESKPDPGVLYIVTPSQYDGLRFKAQFKVKEELKYPNNTAAFYLVSVN